MLRRAAARWVVPGALLAMAAAAASPFFLASTWPTSHEGARYLVLVELFARAMAEGVAYPRVLPDLYGGYGYPTFCFYQPGFFFAAMPFVALPLPLHQALKLAWVAFLAVGGWGAFRLGAQLANRRYGLFAAALFLSTPYLYVDLYVRGDLSEALGLLLGPWVLGFAVDLDHRLARGAPPAPAMAGLALSVAALVLAHPAPAVALLPAVALVVGASSLRSPHGRALLARAAASAALGIALASPYWAGLLLLRGEVGFDRLVGGFYAPELHGASLRQLVSNAWGFGGAGAAAGSREGAMSLQLGAPHLLLAAAGAWAGRRSRAVVAAALGYALLVALVLEPAEPLWRHAGPLRLLQFPWRLLAATATLQVAAAMGLSAWTARLPARSEAWALGAIALVVLLWHRDQFAIPGSTRPPEEILLDFDARVKRTTFTQLATRDEFRPRSARVRPDHPRDPDLPPVRLEGEGSVRALPASGPQRIAVEITAAAPSRAVLEQLYLPGWKIRLDGEALPEDDLARSLTPEGFAWVSVGAGLHRLDAAYRGPPGGALRALGMLAALAAFGSLARSPGARAAGGGPRQTAT